MLRDPDDEARSTPSLIGVSGVCAFRLLWFEYPCAVRAPPFSDTFVQLAETALNIRRHVVKGGVVAALYEPCAA